VELREAVRGELLLDAASLRLAPVERGGGAGKVRLAAPALELEQRRDRVRPRPAEEKLRDRQAGVERLARGALAQSLDDAAAKLGEPLLGEVPVARRADRGQAARELPRREQPAPLKVRAGGGGVDRRAEDRLRAGARQ